MNVKIISDSACEMLQEDIERLGIEIMPLYVSEGDKTYRDGIDITSDVLYANMRQGVQYKTSQIPYADFFNKFTEMAKAGQPVLCLSFSSGLSGTYQAAMLAKRDVLDEYPDAEIEVLDTKAVTAGLGLIAEKIAQAAQEGIPMNELVKLAEFYISHIRHVFTVTDLEYLYRGGRLNKGTAVVGNMLKIKPLLDVDEKGELRQIDKARGEKKLLKKMIEYLEVHGTAMDQQTIAVTHADNPELAEEFIQMAGKHFNTTNFKLTTLVPVIGTHSGPGTLAVFFFDALK